jgi:hypothetical protein
MMFHGFMALIGALDYGKMWNFIYLKDCSYAMARFFCWFLEKIEKELNILMLVMFVYEDIFLLFEMHKKKNVLHA